MTTIQHPHSTAQISPKKRGRITKRSGGTYVAFTVYAIIVLTVVAGPLAFVLLGTFTPTGVIVSGNGWLTNWTFDNLETVFRRSDLLVQLMNSTVVTIAQTGLQLLTSLIAAYALVFGRLRKPAIVLGFFLLTMMIPSETTIIANYLTIRELGLFDTVTAVFLPYATTAFGIFLFRQAFLSFPKEIQEAAQLDGAGSIRFLWQFIVPLNKPAIVTVVLTSAIGAWNGFMWPLLVTETSNSRTVQVGIAALSDAQSVDIGAVLAGVAVVSIPLTILVFISRRFLVAGLTQGAVK